MRHILLIAMIIPYITFSQWVLDSNGIGNKYVYSFAFSGPNIFCGTISSPNGGVYISTNNGDIWLRTSLGANAIWALAVRNNYIFAGTTGGVFFSTNNGDIWKQTSMQFPPVYALAISGNYIYAGTHPDNTSAGSVFISTDNGLNWTHSRHFDDWVYALAVKGNYVYAGTIFSGVFLSYDYGNNWIQTGLHSLEVITMAVKDNNIYASANALYQSTNNGFNWTPISFTNGGVLSLTVSDNYMYAGTIDSNVGFYISSDNGVNWTLKNEGMHCLEVRSICVMNNYIFAGTDKGVYRRPVGELVGMNHNTNSIPNKFTLYQNYPNPFNPTTNIKYQIAKSSDVKIIVYDVLGNEVATLVNEKLQPGTYEVEWPACQTQSGRNATNFPSGVYFYKLSAGSYSETRKLILLK